jgi:biotin transporter BioY
MVAPQSIPFFPRLMSSYGARVFLGFYTMIVFSNIILPLQPVPISLINLGTLLVAFFLKPRESLSVAILWILSLMVGFPTGWKSGVLALAGPTAGYIWGCALAIPSLSSIRYFFIDPWLNTLERFEKNSKEFYTMTFFFSYGLLGLLGHVLIYGFGLPLLGIRGGFSPEQVWLFGAAPFIVVDSLKILMAVLYVYCGRK